MQVLLHNSQFFHQKFGGVSRYSTCLTDELIRKNIDIKVISPFYKNNYLKKIDKSNVRGVYLPKYPNLKLLRVLKKQLR